MRFLAIFFVLLMSCSSQEQEIPEDILPVEKMALVIADMEVVEIFIKSLAEEDDRLKAESERYGELLSIHGLTEDDFKRNMEWYRKHPELYEQVYELALEELSSRSAKIK